eukprot:SAG22_NODE_443_length_10453_cov_8.799691_3_plen_66_part_00
MPKMKVKQPETAAAPTDDDDGIVDDRIPVWALEAAAVAVALVLFFFLEAYISPWVMKSLPRSLQI